MAKNNINSSKFPYLGCGLLVAALAMEVLVFMLLWNMLLSLLWPQCPAVQVWQGMAAVFILNVVIMLIAAKMRRLM